MSSHDEYVGYLDKKRWVELDFKQIPDISDDEWDASHCKTAINDLLTFRISGNDNRQLTFLFYAAQYSIKKSAEKP